MIWFNPFLFHRSMTMVMYRQIIVKLIPALGTMADFERIGQKLKAAGIDIMLVKRRTKNAWRGQDSSR